MNETLGTGPGGPGLAPDDLAAAGPKTPAGAHGGTVDVDRVGDPPAGAARGPILGPRGPPAGRARPGSRLPTGAPLTLSGRSYRVAATQARGADGSPSYVHLTDEESQFSNLKS